MIWAYAVRPAGAAPLDAAAGGIGGAPLWSVAAGGVAAVVSAHPAETTVADRDRAVFEHASVVESAHRRGPVLPVRFRTTFGTEERLRRALEDRQQAFLAGLERVAGHVEYGLRVTAAGGREPGPAAPRPPAATATTGRGYLEQVAAHERSVDTQAAAATQAVEAVHAAVGGQAADRWLAATPPAGVLAVLAYLVPCERASSFEDTVAALAQRRGAGFAVTCTGPWPPYSFAPTEVG